MQLSTSIRHSFVAIIQFRSIQSELQNVDQFLESSLSLLSSIICFGCKQEIIEQLSSCRATFSKHIIIVKYCYAWYLFLLPVSMNRATLKDFAICNYKVWYDIHTIPCSRNTFNIFNNFSTFNTFNTFSTFNIFNILNFYVGSSILLEFLYNFLKTNFPWDYLIVAVCPDVVLGNIQSWKISVFVLCKWVYIILIIILW